MTGDEQGYQGWKNYETWAVNLWLGNDHGLYELVREQARQCIEDAPTDRNVPDIWSIEEAARFNLADWLKDDLCEPGGDFDVIPEISGLGADLLGAALSEVDWTEIAEHWIADERAEVEA